MKALLIVNPVSGRKKGKERALTVRRLLRRRGIGCEVLFTRGARDAETFAKNRAAHFDTLICLGGDGTLNETVNGLMSAAHKPLLCYLPVGTTNDFSKTIGMSGDAQAAADTVLGGSVEEIDLGRMDGRYFIYTVSFGIMTQSANNTPRRMKNILGRPAYILTGLLELPGTRAYHMRLRDDRGIIHEGDYVFGCVSNATVVGGLLRLREEDVSLNDGRHEVTLIRKPRSPSALLKALNAIRRRELPAEGVEFFHTSSLCCEFDKPMDFSIDGERFCASGSVTIETEPHAVRLLLPKKRGTQ